MSAAVLQRLAGLLPLGRLLERPEHLAAYESDGLTAFRTRPRAVVIPETEDEVIALVRFCHAERLPRPRTRLGSRRGSGARSGRGCVIALAQAE